MQALEETVVSVVEEVWSSMFGLDISPGDDAVEAARKAQNERSLTVCVQVGGGWEGSILLYSTWKLALEMAAIMFAQSADELADADVVDAFGEVGNIVAGNVKKGFEGTCQISLPAVINGVDYRLIVPGSSDLFKVLFSCRDEPVMVTLLQKD